MIEKIKKISSIIVEKLLYFIRRKKVKIMYKNYKGKEEHILTFKRPYKGDFRVSSPYGMRGSKFHRGCDYVGESGKALYAIGYSKVIRKAYQEDGAGIYLVFQSLWYKDYIEVKYFHLAKTYVDVGDVATAGGLIAVEGNTGHSTGSHLHLEIWINGNHINPEGELIRWIR